LPSNAGFWEEMVSENKVHELLRREEGEHSIPLFAEL
jgi:hypothetical protein